VGTAVSTSLAGRNEELARLEAFLGRAEARRARLVLEGEPGIGKSTLWRAAVERSGELGFRVVEARVAAAERELSFAALGDLLAGTQDEIGRLPAPQRRALRIALVLEEPQGEPPDERAIAVATLELLRRLAADAPLLVALDDLQWLDRASAGVLGFAFRRLDAEPVGVLATARTGSAPPLVELETEERLLVGPLSLQALDQLVQVRLGVRLLRPTLRQLEQASGGNPFYALELAASLLRSGHRLEPGEPLPIRGRLRELVGERLATLTPGGRRAALAAAALAQPTETALRRAARGDADAVDDAVSASVLVRDGETVRFAHPLLASTLYDDASPAERRNLHLRLARLVRDPEERARHLAEAAEGPDETVAEALEVAAANVAARGAPDTGAQLAKRAVELTPPERSAEAHRRRLAWARYVLVAGDPRHAEALLERQLERAAAGSERAEVALELGKASFATGGSSAARAWFATTLHELEGSGEVELRAQVLVELAGLELEDIRLDSDTFEQALALAEQIGKPALLARALGLYAAKLDLSGVHPSEEYWRRALAVEEATGELRIDGPTAAYGAALSFLEGEFASGAAFMRQVADSMRRRSDPLLPIQLLRLSDAARNAGVWDEADRYIEDASELVAQTGLESQAPNCLVYEGRMAMLRGDFELARAKTEAAMRLLQQRPLSDPRAESDGPTIDVLAHSVLARIAVQSGHLAEAHRRFTAHTTSIRRTKFRATRVEPLAEDAACLVGLGELEQASRELRELSELADAPAEHALVARTRGLLAAAEADTGAALAEFERAVELLDSLSSAWPYELARTLLMQGAAQRRARQKLAARATLERARDLRASRRPPLGREDPSRALPDQRTTLPPRRPDRDRADDRRPRRHRPLQRRGRTRALRQPEDRGVEPLQDLQEAARALPRRARGQAREANTQPVALANPRGTPWVPPGSGSRTPLRARSGARSTTRRRVPYCDLSILLDAADGADRPARDRLEVAARALAAAAARSRASRRTANLSGGIALAGRPRDVQHPGPRRRRRCPDRARDLEYRLRREERHVCRAEVNHDRAGSVVASCHIGAA